MEIFFAIIFYGAAFGIAIGLCAVCAIVPTMYIVKRFHLDT